MKLYTETELKEIYFKGVHNGRMQIEGKCSDEINSLTPIELPSDEEIENRYNKFIDTEIELGFLKQEQGEILKWYYKTYFIDKIQGGNK